MKEAIEQIQKQLAELKAASQKEVEDARVRLLGKKGSITALMDEFRTIAPELKREYGQKLNELKKAPWPRSRSSRTRPRRRPRPAP